MNISTLLLSIYSIITSNPLVHEPCYAGTSGTKPLNQQYSDYIEYRNIRLFFQSIDDSYYDKYIDKDFQTILLKNYNILQAKVKERAKDQEICYTILPYSMTGSTCWKKLRKI
jgi:hypothetical protein